MYKNFHPALKSAAQRTPSLMCCILGLVLAAPAMAGETDGKEAAGALSAELGQSRLELFIGDKVKINVFERLGGGEQQDAKNANLIERIELSGEYAVQSDGDVYLPLLGPQSVHGKKVPEALALIEKAFKDAFGKDGRVTLSITARSPIFVVGRVARPGTYEHSGGMTVLHALAQAGGLERPVQGELYEVLREQKKWEEAVDKQKRLTARLEALLAERAGVPPQPSAKLLEIAGEREAVALLAEQQSMRTLTSESRQLKLKGLDATIAAATREITIQRHKMEKMRDSSDAKEQRVAMLEQLASRGNGGSYQMLQAKSEYGDFQERLSEVQVIISQIEERLTQAQNEKSRIITEARLDLERDIATVEEQTAEVVHQVATSAQLMLVARQVSRDRGTAGTDPDDVRFEIVRMTPAGPRQMQADETMPLMPGDLIKIQQPSRAVYGAAPSLLHTN